MVIKKRKDGTPFEAAAGKDLDKLTAFFKRMKAGKVPAKAAIGAGFDLRNALNNNEEKLASKLAIEVGAKLTTEDVRQVIKEMGLKSIADIAQGWITANKDKSAASKSFASRIYVRSSDDEAVVEEIELDPGDQVTVTPADGSDPVELEIADPATLEIIKEVDQVSEEPGEDFSEAIESSTPAPTSDETLS